MMCLCVIWKQFSSIIVSGSWVLLWAVLLVDSIFIITGFQQIQEEKSLEPPPKPPQQRNWRGSVVAPFAGNNMLVLYSCQANSSSKYFVQVLHNEDPIPLPVSISLSLLFLSMTTNIFGILDPPFKFNTEDFGKL